MNCRVYSDISRSYSDSGYRTYSDNARVYSVTDSYLQKFRVVFTETDPRVYRNFTFLQMFEYK